MVYCFLRGMKQLGTPRNDWAGTGWCFQGLVKVYGGSRADGVSGLRDVRRWWDVTAVVAALQRQGCSVAAFARARGPPQRSSCK